MAQEQRSTGVSRLLVPRFSLRVFLFVFVPVTALTTWSAVKYSQVASQKEAVAWVNEQNGHISYDYERPTADGSYPVGAKPPGPKLLREWFGIDFVSEVYCVILLVPEY